MMFECHPNTVHSENLQKGKKKAVRIYLFCLIGEITALFLFLKALNYFLTYSLHRIYQLSIAQVNVFVLFPYLVLNCLYGSCNESKRPS